MSVFPRRLTRQKHTKGKIFFLSQYYSSLSHAEANLLYTNHKLYPIAFDKPYISVYISRPFTTTPYKIHHATFASLEMMAGSRHSILIQAIENGEFEIVNYLLPNGVSAMAKDEISGLTPLAAAAANGHEGIVRFSPQT